MTDGEQEWIAKYRAALETNPIEPPRALHDLLTRVIEKFARGIRWISEIRHHDATKPMTVSPVTDNACAVRKEKAMFEENLNTATLELVKKAG